MFLRGTREHNTFRFYHEQTKERVLAYAVVLSGMESGKVKGSIYELDYAAKAELAIQTALRTDNNRLIYEKGSWELPKEYRFEATPDREYGKFVRYEAVPHDPDALRDLLRDESRKRERLKPGNFKEHIGRLSDEKVLAEAQRLSAAFQSLQASNSPNGTHFVVEVSPWFERIASSKEHERLFALLPYNIRRNISSFFAWLEDENYIVKSPARRIHKIRVSIQTNSLHGGMAFSIASSQDSFPVMGFCVYPRFSNNLSNKCPKSTQNTPVCNKTH